MKNFLYFLTFYCFALTAPGQTPHCSKKILFSYSKRSTWPDDSVQVKKIKINKKKVTAFLKTKSGKQIFAADSVWGYISEDCTEYRLYQGELYKIRQADDIMLYSRYIWNGRSTDIYYYFSRTPDSEIFPVNRKTIMKQFKTNVCLLKHLGNLSWKDSTRDWDKANHTIRFMVWYKECQ